MYKLILPAILLISACSTYVPEPYQDRIHTTKANIESLNDVADFMLLQEPVNFTQRSPANTAAKETVLMRYSNKKIYFLTLLGQYNRFKSYSENFDNKLNHCPSFHTAFKDHNQILNKQVFTPQSTILTESIKSQGKIKSLALFPELSLKTNSFGTTLFDIANSGETNISEHYQMALDMHLGKTFEELTKLCEIGHSTNYFIFENLITYMKENPKFKKNEDSLKALLKTTLFSNYYLLQSLDLHNRNKSRSIASETERFDHEAFTRMNAFWSKAYFNHVATKRIKLPKNI